MIPYTTYNYFLNSFKGTEIPKDSFEKLVMEASRKIRYFTSNKILVVNNDIQDATCSVIELLYSQECLKNKILNDSTSQKSSESVGPWSVNYVNTTQYQDNHIKSEKELNSSVYRICKEYLDNELLFRGV